MCILPSGFTIRKATPNEIRAITTEPRVLAAIGKEIDSSSDFYIELYKDYSLLFELEDRGSGMCEIHIAMPRNSIIASRAMILGGLHWVFEVGMPGTKVLYTTCPEGNTKISNMLHKLGWIRVSSGLGLCEFIFPKTKLFQ